MPVKSPNHHSDRGRQTAADTAGHAANCSCNWIYFTRASENLARLTAALVPSLHLLLLLSSSSFANSVLLSLTHTAIIGGVFSPSAETPERLGPDQPVITASSESHPRDTGSPETWHGSGFLRMDWETWSKMEKRGGVSLAKFGQTMQHNPKLSWQPLKWKLLHENWTSYCLKPGCFSVTLLTFCNYNYSVCNPYNYP